MKWVNVKNGLPKLQDEDYLVAVRNKNKDNGIYIIDIASFSSDGIWIKSNTWEDVTHWRLLPKKPK